MSVLPFTKTTPLSRRVWLLAVAAVLLVVVVVCAVRLLNPTAESAWLTPLFFLCLGGFMVAAVAAVVESVTPAVFVEADGELENLPRPVDPWVSRSYRQNTGPRNRGSVSRQPPPPPQPPRHLL